VCAQVWENAGRMVQQNREEPEQCEKSKTADNGPTVPTHRQQWPNQTAPSNQSPETGTNPVQNRRPNREPVGRRHPQKAMNWWQHGRYGGGNQRRRREGAAGVAQATRKRQQRLNDSRTASATTAHAGNSVRVRQQRGVNPERPPCASRYTTRTILRNQRRCAPHRTAYRRTEPPIQMPRRSRSTPSAPRQHKEGATAAKPSHSAAKKAQATNVEAQRRTRDYRRP